jgi:hypothetical protein
MFEKRSNELVNKYSREFKKTVKNFYIGEVVDNTDEYDGHRIRVVIPGIDDPNGRLQDLPYCFPLLPRHLNILPKVGESVRVIPEDPDKPFDNRAYIGPIISQPHRIKKELDKTTARTGMVGKLGAYETAPSKVLDATGLFPSPNKNDIFNNEDIGLLGRDNADLIIKENELVLRVGKHVVGNILKRNLQNPGILNFKFKEDGTRTSFNVVADYFNFMAISGTPRPSINLTEKDVDEFIELAHPAVFGDFLRDFLKVSVKFMLNHSHNGNNISATSNDTYKQLASFDLESILSKHFRIN